MSDVGGKITRKEKHKVVMTIEVSGNLEKKTFGEFFAALKDLELKFPGLKVRKK